MFEWPTIRSIRTKRLHFGNTGYLSGDVMREKLVHGTSGNDSGTEVKVSGGPFELAQRYPLGEWESPRIVKLVVDGRFILFLVVSDGLDLFGLGSERAIATIVIELELSLNGHGLLKGLRIGEPREANLVVNPVFFLNSVVGRIQPFGLEQSYFTTS